MANNRIKMPTAESVSLCVGVLFIVTACVQFIASHVMIMTAAQSLATRQIATNELILGTAALVLGAGEVIFASSHWHWASLAFAVFILSTLLVAVLH